MKKIFPYILALLSGVILTLAFAPFRIDIIAIISLCIFFVLVDRANTKLKKALIGFIFGLGFYTTGLAWVSVSIELFTDSFAVGASAALLLVIIASLITSTAFALITNYLVRKEQLRLKIFVFPAIWTFVEILKANAIFGGFPWVSIGYSQTENHLIWYASIGGVYFVTYIVAFISSLIAFLIIPNIKDIKKVSASLLVIFVIFVIYVLGFTISNHQWYKITSDKQKVVMVQGDFVQGFKWDYDNFNKIKEYYKNIASKYKNSIILLSENSIPYYKEYSLDYFKEINDIAKNNNSSVLLGSMSIDNDGKYYNAATVVGDGYGTYRKHHLVPFGEYFPLISSFSYPDKFGLSSFSSGDAIQPLMSMHGSNVANFICYEIGYPEQVRDQLQKAGFITVISDDSWFGDSIARYQHLQITQVRAIENAKYVLHDTNNGITVIINPEGQIVEMLPKNTQAILESDVYSTQSYTIWSKIGMLLIWFIIISSITTAVIIRLIRR